MKLISLLIIVLTINLSLKTHALEKDDLFVFIGKKISVEEYELPPPENPNTVYMDYAYKAKYQMIKTLSTHLMENEIEFVAFDHMGTIDFSKNDYVILFLSKFEDEYYHVKYQYFDVHKTSSGRWAYCGKSYGFDGHDDSVFPEKVLSIELDFTYEISYDISQLKEDSVSYRHNKNYAAKEIERRYPVDFFDTSGDKAICRNKGIYAEDLARAHSKYILNKRD